MSHDLSQQPQYDSLDLEIGRVIINRKYLWFICGLQLENNYNLAILNRESIIATVTTILKSGFMAKIVICTGINYLELLRDNLS
jgi:hypothetical protein